MGYYVFTRHGHDTASKDERTKRKEKGSTLFLICILIAKNVRFDSLYYDILVDMRVCYRFGGSGSSSWSTVKVKASRLRKTCDIGDRGEKV